MTWSGNIEFLANKEEITQLVEQEGYSLKMVYGMLKEQGKITIGERQFARRCQGHGIKPKSFVDLAALARARDVNPSTEKNPVKIEPIPPTGVSDLNKFLSKYRNPEPEKNKNEAVFDLNRNPDKRNEYY